MFESWVASVVA